MPNIGVMIDADLLKRVRKRYKSLDLHQGQYLRALMRKDIHHNSNTLELHEFDADKPEHGKVES